MSGVGCELRRRWVENACIVKMRQAAGQFQINKPRKFENHRPTCKGEKMRPFVIRSPCIRSPCIMKALTTCLAVSAIAASALHGSAVAVAAAAQEQEAQAQAQQQDDGLSPSPSSSPSSCCASGRKIDDSQSCRAASLLDTSTSSTANDSDGDDNKKHVSSGPCINADPDCYRRAALGECKSHKGYMTTHCSRACGRCSQEQLPDEATIQKEEEEALRSNAANAPLELDFDCRDLHEMCPIWSGQAECVLNPKYMATACRESCLLCINARASREREENTERIRRKRTYVTSVDAGPQQRMDRSTEEQQDKIRNLLQHMDRYAKINLTDAEVSPATRMLCRNDHDECAILAVQGQCRKDTLYMLGHCSLVCQFCDKVEKFHRCTATSDNVIGHAETSGVFHKAGDLNSFFRQAKEGGRWDEYGPEYISQPNDGHANADSEADAHHGSPWIVRFDSFLSASESKRIIEIANDIGWSDSQVEEEDMFGGNPERVPPRRSSKSTVCPAGAGCDSDPVYTAVMNRVADTIGISRDHFEHTEMVKYEHRDSFGVHHDYRIHDLWRPGE